MSYVREVLVEVYGERIAIVKKEKSQVLVGSGAGMSVARLQGRAGFSWQGLAGTRHLRCPRPGWVPPEPPGCFALPLRGGWRRKRQRRKVARVVQRPRRVQTTDMALQATGASGCEAIAGSSLPCLAWQLRPQGGQGQVEGPSRCVCPR